MNRQVTIGDLRERLTLEEAARIGDGGGGANESWRAVATLWAAMLPLSGDEGLDADAPSGTVSHEIWLRYRAGVLPDMRLRSGDRIFDIRSVIDVGERGRWLRLLCEERRL